MKEIIIGECGSGKSRNYVAPTIRKYNGGVIYITTRDDRNYLEIDDIIKPAEIVDNSFDFLDNMKVFVKYNPDNNMEMTILTQQFIKQYLDRINFLIVIDEANYVLNDNILNFLVYSASLRTDIMIVLQNDSIITEKLKELPPGYRDEINDILTSNWNIINVSDEVISS